MVEQSIDIYFIKLDRAVKIWPVDDVFANKSPENDRPLSSCRPLFSSSHVHSSGVCMIKWYRRIDVVSPFKLMVSQAFRGCAHFTELVSEWDTHRTVRNEPSNLALVGSYALQ